MNDYAPVNQGGIEIIKQENDDGESQIQLLVNVSHTQNRSSVSHARLVKKNSWPMTLADLYVETFNPLLLLLPIMFVHIGILRATILMAVMTLLQIISAKLNYESTRL